MREFASIFEALPVLPQGPLEGRAKGHKESRTREDALRFYARKENRIAGFGAELLRALRVRLDSPWVFALGDSLRYSGPAAIESWVTKDWPVEPESVETTVRRIF